MDEPANDVPVSELEIRPLLIGTNIPELTLADRDGRPFNPNAAIAPKPAILVFYRGGW